MNLTPTAWGSGAKEFQDGLDYVVKKVEKRQLEKLGSSYETLDSLNSPIDEPPDLFYQMNHTSSSSSEHDQQRTNNNHHSSGRYDRRISSDVSNASNDDDPLTWDSEKVGDWLKELGLPADAFLETGVTGEDLFALGKGRESASGTKALNKLRPFLARRVVYEAERLMAILDPNAPSPSTKSLLPSPSTKSLLSNTQDTLPSSSNNGRTMARKSYPQQNQPISLHVNDSFPRNVSDSLEGSNSLVNYGSPLLRNIPQSPIHLPPGGDRGGGGGDRKQFVGEDYHNRNIVDDVIHEPIYEPMEPLHPRDMSDSESDSNDTLSTIGSDDDEGESANKNHNHHDSLSPSTAPSDYAASLLASPIAWRSGKNQINNPRDIDDSGDDIRNEFGNSSKYRSDPMIKVDSVHETDDDDNNHNNNNHQHHHHGIHEPIAPSAPMPRSGGGGGRRPHHYSISAAMEPPKRGMEPPTPKRGMEPPTPKRGMEPPTPKRGMEPPTPKRGIEPPTPKRGMEPPTPKRGMEPPTPKRGMEPPTPKRGMEPPTPKRGIQKVGKSPRKSAQFDAIEPPIIESPDNGHEGEGGGGGDEDEYMTTTLTGLFGKLEEKKLRHELSKLDNLNLDKQHHHRHHHGHNSDNGSISSNDDTYGKKPRIQSIKMVGLSKSHPISSSIEEFGNIVGELRKKESLKSEKDDNDDNDTISSASTLASSDDEDGDGSKSAASFDGGSRSSGGRGGSRIRDESPKTAITPKRAIQMTGLTRNNSGSFDSKQDNEGENRKFEPKTPKGARGGGNNPRPNPRLHPKPPLHSHDTLKSNHSKDSSQDDSKSVINENQNVQVEQERKMKAGRKVRAPMKMVVEKDDDDSGVDAAVTPSSKLKQHHQKMKEEEEEEAKKKQQSAADASAGGGRKKRGIGKIVLDLSSNTENDEEGGGGSNKPSAAIVCETPSHGGKGGGGGGGGGTKKLLPVGTKQLLMTKKEKEKKVGDFDEEGVFSYGEWHIDEDGIQSMPVDDVNSADINTARAAHNVTASGRTTPYSGRSRHTSHDHSSGLTAPMLHNLGPQLDTPGMVASLNKVLRPLDGSFDDPSEPLEPILSIDSTASSVARRHSAIRQPKLTSLQKKETLNPLQGPGGGGGGEDQHHRGSSPDSSVDKEGKHHKHKHKHHHHHRHHHHHHHKHKSKHHDSDEGSLDNHIYEPEEPLTEASPLNIHGSGDFEASNDTWGSVPKSHPNLNLSLGGSGGGGINLGASQDSYEESGDDLLSSLKFDKLKMPVGGAGGDFEREHRGFIAKRPEEPVGIRASDLRQNRHQQQRNMDMIGQGTRLQRSDSVDSARSTGSAGGSTPRRTKSNLVKLEELGRGAGGVVYKAIHIPTMTIVAVKHMYVEDEGLRRQMQRELNILKAFNSKPLQKYYALGDVSKLSRTQEIIQLRENEKQNKLLSESRYDDSNEEEEDDDEDGKQPEGFGAYVVSMYDAYTDKAERSVCLVLEFMSGGSLESFVKEHRRLSEAQMAHIARCCLLGLSELKKRRLLHRDIKPANILIDHLGNVKLADFGIMKEFEVESLSKTFTGTLAYMSPERILCGSGQTNEGYSYPADIWGLGLSLLALGLGREPLPLVTTIWDVLSCQDESKFMVPSLRNPDSGNQVSYSADLCDMVDCCLRRDPKLRLTADELLKHPFFDKYPYINPKGENNMKRINRSSIVAKDLNLNVPIEPLEKPLFDGVFKTPNASATRMLVNLIKHMNSSPSSGKGVGNNEQTGGSGSGSSLNSSRGGGGPRKYNPLTPQILDRLRSQLPGMEENAFKNLHDRALRGLESDERKKNLMTWANKKTTR